MITVLDCSDWQAHVDFKTLRFNGVEAVMLRCAEGEHTADPDYKARHHQALEAGLHVGPYFFAHPEEGEPELQADHFAAVADVDWRHERALRPMLDYENPAVTGKRGEEWIRRFNHRLLTNVGVGPSFYSYPALIAELALERPAGWGLWLSAFDRNDGSEHPFSAPHPWRRVVAHQFSSRCTVAGVAGLVDLSHARSLEPLLANPKETT